MIHDVCNFATCLLHQSAHCEVVFPFVAPDVLSMYIHNLHPRYNGITSNMGLWKYKLQVVWCFVLGWWRL